MRFEHQSKLLSSKRLNIAISDREYCKIIIENPCRMILKGSPALLFARIVFDLNNRVVVHENPCCVLWIGLDGRGGTCDPRVDALAVLALVRVEGASRVEICKLMRRACIVILDSHRPDDGRDLAGPAPALRVAVATEVVTLPTDAI